MVWFGLVWFGLVWHSLLGLIVDCPLNPTQIWTLTAGRCNHFPALSVMVWLGMAWYGKVWYARRGLVWFGMVWFGLKTLNWAISIKYEQIYDPKKWCFLRMLTFPIDFRPQK